MSQMTTADLLALPPTIDLVTAARALGCGRTLAYELARRGRFPCRVLRVGNRYLIPTADLLRTLSASRPEGNRKHPQPPEIRHRAATGAGTASGPGHAADRRLVPPADACCCLSSSGTRATAEFR